MPMANIARIRKYAVSLSLTAVLLHTCLRVIGFDEHRFARNAGEWVHRYSRQAATTSQNLLYNLYHEGSIASIHEMHSPSLEVVDLMDWEVECIKEGALLVKSNETSRSKNRQQYSRCMPPADMIQDCCEGAYSSAGTVVNIAFNKCSQFFQSSAHRNSSLQMHARAFLTEMPVPSWRKMEPQEGATNVHCDVCQLVELSRQHNLTITFVGDSMQAQVWQGLIYELQRRNYTTRLFNNSTQNEGFWKTKIQYRETLEVQAWGPSSPPVIMKFFQVYILPFQYKQEMAEVVDSGDVLVLGFGLHWNSDMPQHPMSVPTAYVSSMRDLLAYIHQNSTRTQLLIHRETSAQHFDAPAGDYSIWHKTPDRAQECKPITFHSELSSWRETCVRKAASQAGYRYVMAGSNMPPFRGKPFHNQTGPNETNFGMSSDRMSAEELVNSPLRNSTTKELLVLPFYNFTAQHYDQHPPEKVADCTHYCPSPFLYLPLWRSLRIVMDRQYAVSFNKS